MESLGIIFSGPRRGCLRTEPKGIRLRSNSSPTPGLSPARHLNRITHHSTRHQQTSDDYSLKSQHKQLTHSQLTEELEEIDGATINRSRDFCSLIARQQSLRQGKIPELLSPVTQPASQPELHRLLMMYLIIKN
jgi:hypothetical protein